MAKKSKKITLELDYEAVDSLLITILKRSISNIRNDGKLFNQGKIYQHPDDAEYNKKYLAACKVVLHHFGG